MAEEMYQVKNNSSQVFVTVTVKPTGGIEKSTIELTTTTVNKVIASSADGVGSIPRTWVGAGSALNISLLDIETTIYFLPGMSEMVKKKLFEGLNITYLIEGGIAEQTFTCMADDKIVSSEGDLVTVNKYINLNHEEE